jgi:nucleoside 2-deoxyribosyltransferase/sugar/nucleoside kinase (ribokinase family)
MNPVLIIGEIFVDVTILPSGQENKLRLGGIAHAARGCWALGIPFSALAVLPRYLEESARQYFDSFGCESFLQFGEVIGAPNITLIYDQTEIGDQGYETLLRDEKRVQPLLPDLAQLKHFSQALVFPGSYDLLKACALLPDTTELHIDAAYDVANIEVLQSLKQPISSILLSTSSQLFQQAGGTDGISGLIPKFATLNPRALVLKENRGGSRVHIYANSTTISVPAQLSETTVNSVGVGDVYDAAFAGMLDQGPAAAGTVASFVSAAYAQTTEPDIFKKYAQRSLRTGAQTLAELGGTLLPWEMRRSCEIYLAAPDFSDRPRPEIERAVAALEYHNFRLRRPVKENAELRPNSDKGVIRDVYQKDVDLLRACRLVFAIPSDRDPGTLIEMGLAIELGIPVVTYDPLAQSSNTMVIAGSAEYSSDLNVCLNAVFATLSVKP